MSESAPALIALDWGTSSLRAYLVERDGNVLEKHSGPEGIMAASGPGFDTVFESYVEGWFASYGDLPVIMSGMIGSSQGWVPAPYRDCPAGLQEIASALVTHRTRMGRTVHVVPGLCTREPGAAPDVMRGEETQLIGCLAGGRQRGLFALPGTHSKWALLESGRIQAFSTFMTGEMYAALKDHTILGRLITAAPFDDKAFEKGVAWGVSQEPGAGGLLKKLFSVRSRALFEEIAPGGVAPYLSGLLIGTELAEVKGSGWLHGGTSVTIVGSHQLCNLYRRALDQCGIPSEDGPPEAAAAGLAAIANARGLFQ